MFESLASASTPSAVLTTVVSGLGREFSRVALFRVRGSRLECVSHVGFEFEGDVAKVVIPTSLDCLMTRAVESRTTQTFVTGTSDEPCAVPFGGTPACAVALPLISGDAPVAVVYADDSDQLEFGSVPAELLVKFAELVWQHAILVLQRASRRRRCWRWRRRRPSSASRSRACGSRVRPTSRVGVAPRTLRQRSMPLRLHMRHGGALAVTRGVRCR